MNSARPPTDGSIQRDGGTYEIQPISSDEQPVEAIVRIIATYAGRDPLELTPLYDYIDPDAVNALFDAESDRNPDSLVFAFEDYEIVVMENRIGIRSIQ